MTDAPTREIGSAVGPMAVNGWTAWAGGDDIERVPELMWPNSVAAYRAMMNDAQSFSLMNGLTLPIRAYRWFIDENSAPPEAVQRVAADYNLPIGQDDSFKRRRGQRRFSFEKHLEDALRALQYGHYPFEQVGAIEADNKWHLKKLAPRPPRTITEINLDPKDGSLVDIVQGYNAPHPLRIPIGNMVWYAWDREGANWVGKSMLRPIYRNHIIKDRVLRVGAINIERAGGVPYVEAPDGASGDQIRELDRLARNFRVGEAAGAALPHGAQLKFASAASGDGAVAYIKQQNEEMSRAFFQMVIMLGQTNSGSRALGDTFHEILKVAQFTIAKWFCDIFNEYVVEDDIEWNEGPDQEFAPLLKFDAGAQDPMMGIQQAAQSNAQDPNGMNLQVNDPQTRAAIGLDPLTTYVQRREAARRGSTEQVGEGGRVSATANLASPIALPPRPLRRAPYAQEINAAVDFAVIDSSFEMSLLQLEGDIRMARMFQADELRDAVVEADGDVRALSAISTTVSASDRIEQQLALVAGSAIDQAVQEANRQGVSVDRQPVEDVRATLRARSEAIDTLLREDITQSARREAIRLTGGGLSATEVADQTHIFLTGLVGAVMTDLLGGAVQTSINEGRKLVFLRDGQPGILYASEILDTNTCSHCIDVDGRSYTSMNDAERDYPTGHFKDCEGRERCRGTLIKVYEGVQ